MASRPRGGQSHLAAHTVRPVVRQAGIPAQELQRPVQLRQALYLRQKTTFTIDVVRGILPRKDCQRIINNIFRRSNPPGRRPGHAGSFSPCDLRLALPILDWPLPLSLSPLRYIRESRRPTALHPDNRSRRPYPRPAKARFNAFKNYLESRAGTAPSPFPYSLKGSTLQNRQSSLTAQ